MTTPFNRNFKYDYQTLHLLTTAKYTHLTASTDRHTKTLINDLMNGFSIQWGKVK